MSNVELGSAMNGDMHSLLVRSVAEEVMRRVRVPTPVVNVAAPSVAVKSPEITLQPSITVDVPEFEFGESTIILPGMEKIEERLATISIQLGQLITLLGKPVTKTVDRSAQGLIDKVTERRG